MGCDYGICLLVFFADNMWLYCHRYIVLSYCHIDVKMNISFVMHLYEMCPCSDEVLSFPELLCKQITAPWVEAGISFSSCHSAVSLCWFPSL